MLSEVFVFIDMYGIRLRPIILLLLVCATGALAPAAIVFASEGLIERSGIDFERDLEYTEAIRQYEEEIAALESELGQYDHALFSPLMGMARSHYKLGNLDAAKESIQRAQHLSHRHEGVHALSQLEGVELMTKIYLDQNKPLLADKQQRFAYYVGANAVNPDSLEALPAIEKLADWYTKTGQLHRARKLNERGIEIVENHFGEDSIKQLPYLQQLAKLKRLQRVCCSTRVMEQALSLIEENPDISEGLKANTYLQVADAYTASNSQKKAAVYYTKAWSLMSPVDRQSNFSKPQRIVFSRPLNESIASDTKFFKPERDPFGGSDFRELSRDELRSFGSVPPQEFVVAENDSDYNVRIRDRTLNNGFAIEPAMRTVGKPFTFLHEQLLWILPSRFHQDQNLAAIRLHLQFDVDDRGRASNIKVIGPTEPTPLAAPAVPAKLTRLMRDVVRKTRFRPRMENGVIVSTRNHTLTQTFL